MKGVIIAAGAGTRLKSLTREIPKPLVSVLGRPLIDYTIEAFVQAGFTRLCVVVGHKGHLLLRYLGDGRRYGIRIRCLPNAHYRLGNATSILASRPFVRDEPFVVAMADHMISAAILKRLLACAGQSHTLCVDRQAQAPPQVNDATKVWVDDQGFVVHIGKKLTRWNAIDAGVFALNPSIFYHISACLHDDLCSITRTIRRLIARGDHLKTCDISGAFWLDVDTPEDLRYASTVLRRQELIATIERKEHATRDPGPSAGGKRSTGSSISVRHTPNPTSVAGSANLRLATGGPGHFAPGPSAD